MNPAAKIAEAPETETRKEDRAERARALLDAIAADARARAEGYLDESRVPEGGE